MHVDSLLLLLLLLVFKISGAATKARACDEMYLQNTFASKTQRNKPNATITGDHNAVKRIIPNANITEIKWIT
jgi:hypothetical protein